jgi:hypothetical protein
MHCSDSEGAAGEARTTLRDEYVRAVTKAAGNLIGELIGFNERAQLLFCRNCGSERGSEGKLHKSYCSVYDLQAALEMLDKAGGLDALLALVRREDERTEDEQT